jgi:hypothetical protein
VAVVEDYCRDVEAYLCRKNDGHLIRIVGPAFEQVCGWATRGVPLNVAMRGIDRYFDRYYAKGPRRRPVRVEFGEADVLDVFDEWRRALGITIADARRPMPRSAVAIAAGTSQRVIARLTALRAGRDRSLMARWRSPEVDVARGPRRSSRRHRQRLIEQLREMDPHALDAACAQCDEVTRRALDAEADGAGAIPRSHGTEAYEQSRRAAIDRLVRDRRWYAYRRVRMIETSSILTLNVEARRGWAHARAP